MRQQCGHAQLGIAWEHSGLGAQLCTEVLLIVDMPAQLFRHFVAQCIRDHDKNTFDLRGVKLTFNILFIEIALQGYAAKLPGLHTVFRFQQFVPAAT